MRFFAPMRIPTVTHQEQGLAVVNGKPRVYDTPEIKEARAAFQAHLAKHRPIKPINGPVRLIVKFLFPITKAGKAEWYKITRPDLDNLEKLLLDAMTKLGFWGNDARICSKLTEKFHSDFQGLFIEIFEIDQRTGRPVEANPKAEHDPELCGGVMDSTT